MSNWDEYSRIYDTFADLENGTNNVDYRYLKQYPNDGRNFEREKRQYNYDDDDVEDFITEDEIEEEKKEREKIYKKYNGSLSNIEEDRIPTNPLPNQIQDELYEDIQSKRVQKKWTEKELKDIRDSCNITYVRDYSLKDPYHLSDEERAERDVLREIRRDLNKVKAGYSDVAQYVLAMRTVVKAWELLAKKNQFYSLDEFFELVGCGEIVSPAIPHVELSNRKDYNAERLIEYISNPELDVNELIPDTEENQLIADNVIVSENDRSYDKYKEEFKKEHYDEYYGEVDLDTIDDDELERINNEFEADSHYYAVEKVDKDNMKRYFSVSEMNDIQAHTEDDVIRAKPLEKKFIKNYNNKGIHRYRQKNKLSKTDRRIAKDIHYSLRRLESMERHNIDYIGGMDDMFVGIKPRKSMLDKDFTFRGSLQNKYDVELFEMEQFDEYMRSPSNSRQYQTNGSRLTEIFFDKSEENDLNMMKMRRSLNRNVDERNKLIDAKTRKENKKNESRIISRLIKYQESKRFKKEAAKAEAKLNKTK